MSCSDMLRNIQNLFRFSPLHYHIVLYGCTSIIADLSNTERLKYHASHPHCDNDITNMHPRPRQNHHCSLRLRGHPQDGRRKRTTPEGNFQVTIPPGQRRRPDHWAPGRRCQLPRLLLLKGKNAPNKPICAWPGVSCCCNERAALNRAANTQHSGGGAAGCRDQNRKSDLHIPRYT